MSGDGKYLDDYHDSPPVRGGQGRDDDDVIVWGFVTFACVLVAAILVAWSIARTACT